ncbi:nucleoside deaminase [symbiont of Argiope bruennichi]|uniref:nucleoside deaminase n=1 Tax=symbiont of Argiope bruennichi TaxID=2810479 RepID=UPI003DA259B5
MKAALKEANKAQLKKLLPVGCVVLLNNKIILKTHNNGKKNSIFNHAEIIALKKLEKLQIPKKERKNYIFFVTMEPCMMCYGALINFGIKNIFFCCENYKFSIYKNFYLLKENKMFDQLFLLNKISLFEEKSSNLIKNFFKQKRNSKS